MNCVVRLSFLMFCITFKSSLTFGGPKHFRHIDINQFKVNFSSVHRLSHGQTLGRCWLFNPSRNTPSWTISVGTEERQILPFSFHNKQPPPPIKKGQSNFHSAASESPPNVVKPTGSDPALWPNRTGTVHLIAVFEIYFYLKTWKIYLHFHLIAYCLCAFPLWGSLKAYVTLNNGIAFIDARAVNKHVTSASIWASFCHPDGSTRPRVRGGSQERADGLLSRATSNTLTLLNRRGGRCIDFDRNWATFMVNFTRAASSVHQFTPRGNEIPSSRPGRPQCGDQIHAPSPPPSLPPAWLDGVHTTCSYSLVLWDLWWPPVELQPYSAYSK